MSAVPLPGEPVGIPLPPGVGACFGYAGRARFVGVRYTCLGDEVVLDDGRSRAPGATWAFLSFKRHRAVEPLLRAADLGNSERDGTQMLLLDTRERRAHIAPLREARAFLDSQWPEREPLTPAQEAAFRAELERLSKKSGTSPSTGRRSHDSSGSRARGWRSCWRSSTSRCHPVRVRGRRRNRRPAAPSAARAGPRSASCCGSIGITTSR